MTCWRKIWAVFTLQYARLPTFLDLPYMRDYLLHTLSKVKFTYFLRKE